MSAIASWHDPAGVTILVACFICLWIAAWRIRGKEVEKAPEGFSPAPILRTIAVGLGCWIVLVEAGTEIWFRAHERSQGTPLEWSTRWPRQNPSFEVVGLSPQIQRQLGFDQGAGGRWRQPDGTQWQMFYLRWLPVRSLYGRVKVSLAKSHSPEFCLQAAGMKMIREIDPIMLDTKRGFSLNFRRFIFDSNDRKIEVFFSVEEALDANGSLGFLRRTHWARFQAALAGSRNYGQRTLEIAISGLQNDSDATSRLASELPDLIDNRE
jgi:hypothetical protein